MRIAQKTLLGAIAWQLILLIAAPTSSKAAWYSADWKYRRQVTIDSALVVGGNQTNFPILLSVSLSEFRDVGHGGNVEQATGADFLVTTADGVTKLSHEIESFSPSTGRLVAWVKVPTLYRTQKTILYVYYGNPSCTDQQNATQVWDSNYKGVWHLGEQSQPYLDATTNGNQSTGGVFPASAAGMIGSGQDFNGTTNYVQVVSSSLDISGNKTVEAWVYVRSFSEYPSGVDRRIIIKRKDSLNCYQLTVNHYNNNSFCFGHLRNGSENTVFGGSNLAPNAWYHVVGVWNGSSTIYINGQPANSGAGIWGTGTSSELRIGNRSDGTGFLDGVVDEVRISNSARSANWIATEYNNMNSPSTFCVLASEESSVPLPVELESVTAAQVSQAQAVRVSWRTRSETNNYGFYVQRSGGAARGFVDLEGAFVSGHLTTLNPQEYSWVDQSVLPGNYLYRLKQVDLDGATSYSAAVSVAVVGWGTSASGLVPGVFGLAQNYPNPFNPSTTITFSIAEGGHVTLRILDVLGREVANLLSEERESGIYSVRWDANVAAGVYFCELRAGRWWSAKKLNLVR